MKILFGSLLLACLALPAQAQERAAEQADSPEARDDEDEPSDGGSRRRPQNPKPGADKSGSQANEAAVRASAGRAIRGRGNAGFRDFTGAVAQNPRADLRAIEGKGDGALAARGRAISPAGQAIANGRAPIAAAKIGIDDRKAFAAAARRDEAAKLAKMRTAARSGRAAKAARVAAGSSGLGAAIIVVPVAIEVLSGADIGLERYVLDGGKAIATGDSDALAAANRDLGQRAVGVGKAIALTAQDPARIVRNIDRAADELAQTGEDVGAAVTGAARNPAKVGRDAAKIACSVGSIFTGGKC